METRRKKERMNEGKGEEKRGVSHLNLNKFKSQPCKFLFSTEHWTLNVGHWAFAIQYYTERIILYLNKDTGIFHLLFNCHVTWSGVCWLLKDLPLKLTEYLHGSHHVQVNWRTKGWTVNSREISNTRSALHSSFLHLCFLLISWALSLEPPLLSIQIRCNPNLSA